MNQANNALCQKNQKRPRTLLPVSNFPDRAQNQILSLCWPWLSLRKFPLLRWGIHGSARTFFYPLLSPPFPDSSLHFNQIHKHLPLQTFLTFHLFNFQSTSAVPQGSSTATLGNQQTSTNLPRASIAGGSSASLGASGQVGANSFFHEQ